MTDGPPSDAGRSPRGAGRSPAGTGRWPAERTAVVAFLATSYPVVTLLAVGAEECVVVCDGSPLRIAAVLAAVVAGCAALGAAVAWATEFPDRWRDRPLVSRILAPSNAVASAVLVTFVGFVGVLLAVTAGPLSTWFWPTFLASLVLYPFLWALYALTFLLAAGLSAAGLDTGPVATYVARVVVLVGGFWLSLAWQLLVVDAVATAVGDLRARLARDDG